MDGFVAAGRPAGALRQPRGVIGIADEDSVALLLLLEVAFQTECLVALIEHAGIDRAVR